MRSVGLRVAVAVLVLATVTVSVTVMVSRIHGGATTGASVRSRLHVGNLSATAAPTAEPAAAPGADSVVPFGGAGLGPNSLTTPDTPVVGMASTPDGQGYWLVAADGGIFTFGDAPFDGSAA